MRGGKFHVVYETSNGSIQRRNVFAKSPWKAGQKVLGLGFLQARSIVDVSLVQMTRLRSRRKVKGR